MNDEHWALFSFSGIKIVRVANIIFIVSEAVFIFRNPLPFSY